MEWENQGASGCDRQKEKGDWVASIIEEQGQGNPVKKVTKLALSLPRSQYHLSNYERRISRPQLRFQTPAP